jgi:hypothetical protein
MHLKNSIGKSIKSKTTFSSEFQLSCSSRSKLHLLEVVLVIGLVIVLDVVLVIVLVIVSEIALVTALEELEETVFLVELILVMIVELLELSETTIQISSLSFS